MQAILNENLEQLKRLSLRWIIRKGKSLAEAEDIFQQSILKALTSDAQLLDQQKLQSWFMSILKNTLLDHIRSQNLHREKETTYQLEKELDQPEPELEASFCKCVKSFLNELPENDQSLLQKHFFEGKTFSVLAKENGSSESSLRVKSLRARETLKGMFKACCNVRKFKDLDDCGCE